MATLTGTAGNDTLTGTAGSDILNSLAGNDILDGAAGADTMTGGPGDDTYVVDNAGDRIVENAGEGTDTVKSGITWTLGANLEKLILTGTGNINGTGNALDNDITGNAGNNVIDGGAGADTMTGGKGDDTYIVDNVNDKVIENAGEGIDTVKSSVDCYLANNVENLILTGTAQWGFGNALDNDITGNDAANALDGGAGRDILRGGKGDDAYLIDDNLDIIVENANEGTDIAYITVSYTLADNVETLSIRTDANGIVGTGNALNNYMIGGAGNNTLNGGAGNDTMLGSTGDDTYIVDSTYDYVAEYGGEGNDTVMASANYTLSNNVEMLVLTGILGWNGTGNALDNTITGNDGDNVIDGAAGGDTMKGGKGNDTYVVDSSADKITENTGEGTDTVRSSISWTLGAAIENLTLTGTAAINGTGNSLDNVLTGNSGANTLDGGTGNDTLDGGIGADMMKGGKGDDTYIVDNAGDVVVENAGEGTDTVKSGIDYTLGSNVENLVLLSGAVYGTGNALNNSITGNAGDNILNGGAGTDTMTGGVGNDTYYVDDKGDVIVEKAGEGIDTVHSSVEYALGDNIENLFLDNKVPFDGTYNGGGFGNALDNLLVGNDFRNYLIGKDGNDTLDGGAGADDLEGGAGDDIYYVDNQNDLVYEKTLDGKGTDAGGRDTVHSAIDFSLVENSRTVMGLVENLILGPNGSAIRATGNDLDNEITGNSSDNLIDGGKGKDIMRGGAGNDAYTIDNASDMAIEKTDAGADAGGLDIVYSSVTFTLGDFIEKLTLAGSGNINGTGNALDNQMTGNAGNNILDGGAGDDSLYGGLGADTMKGGSGNDTSYVDNAGDTVSELDTSGKDAGGIDTVYSTVSFSLAAYIEKLVLTGTDSIDATGNDAGNALTGNAGNNILRGGGGDDILQGGNGNDLLDGGTGADVMYGGTGGDKYVVDNGADAVSETLAESWKVAKVDGTAAGWLQHLADMTARAGLDEVQTTLNNYKLGANLELLVLTGSQNIDGSGNQLDNGITGNGKDNGLAGLAGDDKLWGGGGNDTLDGGDGDDMLDGGYGHDTLVGGAGRDLFTFGANFAVDSMTGRVSASYLEASSDTVRDFHHGEDLIALSLKTFSALSGYRAGDMLKAENFRDYAYAATERQFLLYDAKTGTLWYDDNGNAPTDGWTGRRPVATFTDADGKHPLSLDASDFMLIA